MTDTMTNGKDWAEEEAERLCGPRLIRIAAIAESLRAAEARGIERAAVEVRVMAANARENDTVAAKARGAQVNLSIAGNVLDFAAIHIASLLPADKKGGGR